MGLVELWDCASLSLTLACALGCRLPAFTWSCHMLPSRSCLASWLDLAPWPSKFGAMADCIESKQLMTVMMMAMQLAVEQLCC